MVPRRGLEPPRLAAQVPETCASTNSAIWAARVHVSGSRWPVNRVFQKSGISVEGASAAWMELRGISGVLESK